MVVSRETSALGILGEYAKLLSCCNINDLGGMANLALFKNSPNLATNTSFFLSRFNVSWLQELRLPGNKQKVQDITNPSCL